MQHSEPPEGRDRRKVERVPPPPAREDSDKIFVVIIVAVLALVTMAMVEVQFIALIHEGATNACVSPPAGFGTLHPTGTAEFSVLPPRLVCHYRVRADPGTTLADNMYGGGTTAFWVCTTVLVACAASGLILRRGANR
ncbi:hypothetical protein [Kocuria sp. CH-021]|uniref:hypothetical protein n=1 Tax=Kocuria sp. CH-021 TaxID=3406735 RepID=UPI003C740AF4